MDILAQFHDAGRSEMDIKGRALDTRKGEFAQATLSHDSAERLLRFDGWLRGELATRINWDWAGAEHRQRRIEQAAAYMERLVLELWRRGWMLDGKRLAVHLTTCLDRVGAYQRKGAIGDFWPYFRSVVDRYVGANAEELQAEALSVGAHVGALLGKLLKQSPTETPITELVAQRADEVTKAKTIREQQAEIRRVEKAAKACRAEGLQGSLF